MNLLKGSSNLCLGLIGLRGRCSVRSHLQFDYKFFSVSQCMRNGNDDSFPSEVEDTDDARHRGTGPGENFSTNELGRNKEPDGILNKNNFNRSLPGSNCSIAKTGIGDKRFDPENIKSLRPKNCGIHTTAQQNIDFSEFEGVFDSWGFSGGEKTDLRVRKNFNPYLGKGKWYNSILQKSGLIPFGNPCFWKYFQKGDAEGDGVYFIEGIKFMVVAKQIQVNPQVIFYCDVRQIEQMPFNPQFIEYYYVSKKWMTHIFGHQTVFAVYSKSSILRASQICRKMPVTIVTHKFDDKNLLRFLVICAANFRCNKFITTEGSLYLDPKSVLKKFEEALLTLPLYDNVKWSQMEHKIDQSTEIYLLCPSDDAPHTAHQSKRLAIDEPIPVVDIMSVDFWTQKQVMLIVSRARVTEDKALRQFCTKWKVRKVISSAIKGSEPESLLPALLGEITRQRYYKFPELRLKFYKTDFLDSIRELMAQKKDLGSYHRYDGDDDDGDDDDGDLYVKRKLGMETEESRKARDEDEVDMEVLLQAGRQKGCPQQS